MNDLKQNKSAVRLIFNDEGSRITILAWFSLVLAIFAVSYTPAHGWSRMLDYLVGGISFATIFVDKLDFVKATFLKHQFLWTLWLLVASVAFTVGAMLISYALIQNGLPLEPINENEPLYLVMSFFLIVYGSFILLSFSPKTSYLALILTIIAGVAFVAPSFRQNIFTVGALIIAIVLIFLGARLTAREIYFCLLIRQDREYWIKGATNQNIRQMMTKNPKFYLIVCVLVALGASSINNYFEMPLVLKYLLYFITFFAFFGVVLAYLVDKFKNH
ncbi:hypothetical protein [Xylocopilactobacillus apicola]|uniref:Beta-carotene 15,15'-monooxygenase n=1 Tax=Xylocopilactobacillus apicola TaxID=2932184 RepID=A0AAU9CVL3_9LACO|nr:hypothetical protein [Xylocopilactobacillus apicola]BDR58027.1 hypothetical protein XA3_04680 [Xylocopilactobacillus apicola]